MPVTQIRAFHRPATVAAAWALVRDGDGTVALLAGGTDLTIHPPATVTRLVDLGRLGLDRITVTDDGITIGAMATLTDLLEHPALATYAGGVLGEMLVHVGSPLLRNAARVGGHLARGRLSDVVPVLLACDAEVSLFDGEDHRVALEDYYATGRHRTAHVLTAVHLPPAHHIGAAGFVRFSRAAFDVATVCCACRVRVADDGRTADARVVVGQAPTLGVRLPAAEAALTGAPLTEATIEGAAQAAGATLDTAVGGMGASEAYRRQLATVGVRRGLTAAAARLTGGGA